MQMHKQLPKLRNKTDIHIFHLFIHNNNLISDESRRLFGVRWRDFVTNVTVSESTGLSDIRDIIAERRHSLFGRIRPADVPAHMALKLSIDICSELNLTQTGPALGAVRETPGSGNLKRTAASRRVNSWRRPGTTRTRWLYDYAPGPENDDDDESY